MDAPLLAVVGIAPLVAGYQDPLPPLALACLAWLAFLWRLIHPAGRAMPLRRPAGAPLVLLFLALSGLSLAWSANPGATLLQTALYAGYGAVLWLAADCAARGGAPRLLGALLVGALVVGVLGLQEYAEQAKGGNPGWRAFATFTNPNFLAGYLIPGLLLALSLVFIEQEALRPPLWMTALGLLIGTLGAGVMVTGSRGGLAALGVGLVSFLLLAARQGAFRERSVLVRLVGMLGLLLLVGAAFSTTLRGRDTAGAARKLPAELCPHAADSATSDSNRFRRYTWASSINMGRARPLTGWGAGAFETAYAPHTIAGYTRHAHNSYLQLFAEEGIVAVLLWLALLGAAFVGAWRAPRDPGRAWTAGAGAALLALAAHNLLDSIWFVPASAFFVWALLGMLMGAGPRDGESETDGRNARPVLPLAIGATALFLTLLLTVGCLLLSQGQANVRPAPAQALETLKSAQALLPWDHRVAVAQGQAAGRLGRLSEATDAARRAISLAPLRPPGYLRLGSLQEASGDLNAAVDTYRRGLKPGPNEVQLWYALAQALERAGEPEEAIRAYGRVAELEASPVGQVHALGEVREWRFARARLALAREAERAGDTATAVSHRKGAACLLAERRTFFTANPIAYVKTDAWSRTMERDLRFDEARVWSQVAEDYRREGQNRLEALAQEQATAATTSVAALEKLLQEMGLGEEP